MKRIFLITLLVFASFQPRAQHSFVCGYNTSIKPIFCDFIYQKSYINDAATLATVKAIVDLVALPQNFVLVECTNIGNAYSYCSATGTRYIIIDSEWLSSIGSRNWFNVAILAHEIGHHLCGHTTKTKSLSLAELRKQELEADRFSGFILQGLGASYNQAISAINTLVPTELSDATSDHPSRSKRLEAIKQGYYKTIPINASNNQKETAEAYFNMGWQAGLEAYKGSWAVIEYPKMIDAINYLKKAIEINPLYIDALCVAGDYYNELGFKKLVSLPEQALSPKEAYLKAIECYKKVIDIAPQYGAGYDGIGYVLCSLGDIDFSAENYSEALTYLNRAVSLNSYDPMFRLHRGYANYMLWLSSGKKLGSHEQSCSDFDMSCKSGVSQGCDSYNKFCK